MEYESYNEFLKSDEWKQVAKMVKDRDGNKCVICGSTENLNAHHIGYNGDRLNEDDIVTLCNRCHECLHDGIKEMKEAVCGGVRNMLADTLSDIVFDFYKRSFTKGNGKFEVCNHEHFVKLQEILEKSIISQMVNSGDIKDFDHVLYCVGYENRSKQKVIAARIDFIKRAKKVGMSPGEIQRRLRISEKQYFKLLKKLREGDE